MFRRGWTASKSVPTIERCARGPPGVIGAAIVRGMNDDQFSQLLSALQPGPLDWITALTTVAAVAVAAITYVRSVRIRRQAQARLVYAKIVKAEFVEPGHRHLLGSSVMEWNLGAAEFDPAAKQSTFIFSRRSAIYTVAVTNGSDELIAPVRVELLDWGQKKFLQNQRMDFGKVEPRQTVEMAIVFADSWYPNQPGLDPRVIFRDSSGRWWQRLSTEPIRGVPRVLRESWGMDSWARPLSRASSGVRRTYDRKTDTLRNHWSPADKRK